VPDIADPSPAQLSRQTPIDDEKRARGRSSEGLQQRDVARVVSGKGMISSRREQLAAACVDRAAERLAPLPANKGERARGG
jgi:hypothetical protein